MPLQQDTGGKGKEESNKTPGQCRSLSAWSTDIPGRCTCWPAACMRLFTLNMLPCFAGLIEEYTQAEERTDQRLGRRFLDLLHCLSVYVLFIDTPVLKNDLSVRADLHHWNAVHIDVRSFQNLEDEANRIL
ncbi:uncharacterized protein LOC143651269 [Tamandua tetradactyla]|uniref:uncharacterized protein LOC143651269 n=1 Tax=Tamandua tetradactyla TaxID=48850 RepID=UPI0040548670